jgi:endonuclease/exonuclease/phosphatase family metal-dependent hydrolase
VAAACGISILLLAGGGQQAGEAAGVGVAKKLRVMTYNIHVGIGMDKELDLARIADCIRRERPDLVGLQEVDRGVERTKRVDQAAELARLTGMEYAFAHNLNYQGGQYGVAVLSRFPILAVDHRRYANRREAERRGFIRVEVLVGGVRVNFVTTHLDYQHADGRLFEAEQLLSALADARGPLIVTGDFNDEPTGSTYRLMLSRFADGWTESRAGDAAPDVEHPNGLTYPADKPVKRIDYIFYQGGGPLRARRAWIPHTDASDHLPLVAELDLLGPSAPKTQTGTVREEHPQQIESLFVEGDSLSYNGYQVVKLKKRIKHEFPPVMKSPPDLIEVSYAVLKKNRRVLATFEGVYFGAGNATDFGLFAFLGGQTKQLAVSQTVPRGGRHWVVDLSSRSRVIFDSGDYGVGREEFSVIDIDKDGVYEISLPITVFYTFENMSMAETPLPEIIFRYDRRAGKYLPANPAFQDYVLRGIEDEIRRLNPQDERSYLSRRLDIVLRYIYAGEEQKAWSFFEREYRLPNAAEMKSKIKAVLKDEGVYKYLYGRRAASAVGLLSSGAD